MWWGSQLKDTPGSAGGNATLPRRCLPSSPETFGGMSGEMFGESSRGPIAPVR
jgi:hypothetical protein